VGDRAPLKTTVKKMSMNWVVAKSREETGHLGKAVQKKKET